jgi:hypothetical protein
MYYAFNIQLLSVTFHRAVECVIILFSEGVKHGKVLSNDIQSQCFDVPLSFCNCNVELTVR